jgi:hypothetical protein
MNAWFGKWSIVSITSAIKAAVAKYISTENKKLLVGVGFLLVKKQDSHTNVGTSTNDNLTTILCNCLTPPSSLLWGNNDK